MAQRGKRLDDWTRRRIRDFAARLSLRRTARELGLARNTVSKYAEKKSDEKPENRN